MTDQPEKESAHAGPDAVASAFFEARQSLAARALRGPGGRFTPANGDSVDLGTRSAQLEPLIDAWVTDQESLILADLGGAENITETQRAVCLQLAKAQVREAISWRSMWRDGGPTTAKGHTRKIAKLNAEDADRVVRYARELGYQRTAKPVSYQEFVNG